MTTIAFDGLSAAGKSTLVRMVAYRAARPTIVRENVHDIYRDATAAAARLIRQGIHLDAVCLEASGPCLFAAPVLNGAFAYSLGFSHDYKTQSQAFLAYMFARGRELVNTIVMEAITQYDSVILDRWQRTEVAKDGMGIPGSTPLPLPTDKRIA